MKPSSKKSEKKTSEKKPSEEKPKKLSKTAIRSEGDPVLREIAKEVPVSEIPSKKIQDVISLMKKALAEQSDGIGLAAPQIGIPLRIFIVSKKVLINPSEQNKAEQDSVEQSGVEKNQKEKNKTESSPISAPSPTATLEKSEDKVFINPVLTKESREKKWMEGEGCLSVRWIYGKVKRSTKVTIRAYNEKGTVIERGASGLLAHIFQHEVDHLNGILFIDKAKDLEQIEPPTNV